MSDTLSCPSCGADIDVGSFPVFEGALRACEPCNLTLVVAVEDYGSDEENIAYLTEQGCEDCDSPPWNDPTCKRCGGSGFEPAPGHVGKTPIHATSTQGHATWPEANASDNPSKKLPTSEPSP